MNKLFKLDWIAISVAILLVGISLIILYSFSAVGFFGEQEGLNNFTRQLIAVGIGIIAMFVLAFYDYRVFNSISTNLYFLMLGFFALVAFLGTTVRGTTGWLNLGAFNVQPVEIAKIILVIFLASFLSKKKMQLGTGSRVFVSLVLIILPTFFVILQPDFGSAMIMIGIWLSMLLASGINKKSFIFLMILGIIFLSVSFLVLEDYQIERLQSFIDPHADPQGSGYNVIQSQVAIGSGGFLGKGLGHGSQSQLNFLPEKHTDFIFAVISEEFGLVGAFVILIALAILLFRVKEIARKARDNFGYLLGVGFLAMFSLQIFVNIGMNLGIAPVVGVPLPFLSYGGSSIISVFLALGFLQSVYSRRTQNLD